MKKPVVIMISIIGGMAVLLAAGIGAYFYLKPGKGTHPAALTAAQARALQVDLPQLTTNLKNGGLIQFTLTLQASDAATKKELTDLQPDVQDSINQTMREFSSDDLKSVQGYNDLKNSIMTAVNHVLQKGHISAAFLSQVVVQ